MITNQLHNQFDAFKQGLSSYLNCGSLVNLNELIYLLRITRGTPSNELIKKNGKTYVHMDGLEVDDLCLCI